MSKYDGGCLCGATTFTAEGEPQNPHLCSCRMCQKSSGAPTVAWVEFPLETFQWTPEGKLALYPSSEKTQRCFCQNCGGLLGALNDGYANICITIASLNNPNLIVPGNQHSYQQEAPSWWQVGVLDKRLKS